MNRKEKREIIISSIIGDGSISKHATTFRLYIGHGYKQLDYLIWKTNLIESAGLKATTKAQRREVIDRKRNTSYDQVFSAWYGKELRLFYKWFRSDGEKSVKHILKYLHTPLSLAIWFMDDGSVFKRKRKHKDGSIYYLKPSCKLCTHSFSEKDNLLILEWLKEKFDIEGYVVVERKKNRINKPEYYTLNFNVENTRKIWDLINPYVKQVPSMKKKFSFIENYYSE